MKRCFCLFLTGLLAYACLQAEVLLVEDFAYDVGERLTANGWYTQYGAASEIMVTNGLSVPRYAASDRGNAALLDCVSGSNQVHRAFREVTEGDVYVAFMLLPSVNYKKGWFFSLRDDKTSADNYTEFNFNARVLLDAGNHIGLTFADNQKARFSDIQLDYSTIYIVVLKYALHAGAQNDAVSLWLLTEPVAAEPSQPLIGPLQDSSKKDIFPANVVLRGYDADGWLVVDGIRVATTWEEAVRLADDVSAVESPLVIPGCGITYIYNCLGTCLGIYTEDAFLALPHGMYILKQETGSRKILR